MTTVAFGQGAVSFISTCVYTQKMYHLFSTLTGIILLGMTTVAGIILLGMKQGAWKKMSRGTWWWTAKCQFSFVYESKFYSPDLQAYKTTWLGRKLESVLEQRGVGSQKIFVDSQGYFSRVGLSQNQLVQRHKSYRGELLFAIPHRVASPQVGPPMMRRTPPPREEDCRFSTSANANCPALLGFRWLGVIQPHFESFWKMNLEAKCVVAILQGMEDWSKLLRGLNSKSSPDLLTWNGKWYLTSGIPMSAMCVEV